MNPVQDAEGGQGADGVDKVEFGATTGRKEQSQPQSEEGQAVEEEDDDDITNKKGRDGIHRGVILSIGDGQTIS